MKILFLGTAAAEGIPALWCTCECCRKARMLGGKNIRHRCSYLIDDDTMVDFGPDTYSRSLDHGLDLSLIRRLIFTHPHSDHMLATELMFRRMPSYCAAAPEWKMDVLGSQEVLRELVRGIFNAPGGRGSAIDPFGEMRVNPVKIDGGRWISSGDVEMLPIPATHAPTLGAMFFVIRRGGRTLLIANDTSFPVDTSWAMLEGIKLDTAVIECTMGLSHPNGGRTHLGFNTTIGFRQKLIDMGCLTKDTPVYANHFSHNGCDTYDVVSEAFAPSGIKVAYDDLVIEV